MKTVSVLVPVYNVENYIERCILSIFNQSYDNLEIIIVDDCTPDNSMSVVQRIMDEYPKRQLQTKIVRHEHNEGLAVTRNTGLDNATGDYVMFVDSDDWLDNNTVSECMQIIEKEDVGVLVFNSIQVYNNFNKLTQFYSYNTKEEYIYNIIARKCPVNVWGKLYKRTIFGNNEARFIPGINNGEDYVTLPRIIYYSSSVVFTDKPYYHYNKTNELSYGGNYKVEYANQAINAIYVLRNFFCGKDTGRYIDAIAQAELLIGSGLIQRCITNVKIDDSAINFDLLKIDKWQKKDIPIYDKLVLYLWQKKCKRVLHLLCKIRFNIANIIKGK